MNASRAEAPGPRELAALVPALGRTLATRAANAGLAVTLPDGSRRAIPIAAVPLVVDDAEIERRRALAGDLVAATDKAARWRMAGDERDAVLDALGPAERRLVEATWNGDRGLAVARVDFMGTQALEVNATIPAMQAYSDIAAASWLEAFAPRGVDARELVAANGSNADALLASLESAYLAVRGEAPRSIGLLCRRGDAQATELEYLRDRFARSGREARIVHPDELVAVGGGFLAHEGTLLDLVYRHLFLSRLDALPAPALEARLRAGSSPGTLVVNRPAPHLEMKSTLATLSRAGDDEALARALGLTARERAAVRAHVPWTRMLGAAHVDEVAAQPDAYVLKRSWSYGGSEVFVGRSRREPSFWPRVQRTFPGVDDWHALVRAAARDTSRGGFVVQHAVPRSESDQYLCTPTSVERTRAVVDYAAFASLGGASAWSGVSRAAASDVVNIVGGGAVVPVIRASVARHVLR